MNDVAAIDVDSDIAFDVLRFVWPIAFVITMWVSFGLLILIARSW